MEPNLEGVSTSPLERATLLRRHCEERRAMTPLSLVAHSALTGSPGECAALLLSAQHLFCVCGVKALREQPS